MSRITELHVPVLIAALAGGTAVADVIEVPADFPTIQAAMSAASSGDEIVVAPGDHAGPVDFLGKTVVLRSSGGPQETRITAEMGSIVTCNSGEGVGTRFEGFKVSGTVAAEGGGMTIEASSAEVVNCIFSDNIVEAGGGGLRYQGPGAVVVRDCVFRENAAGGGGGMFIGSQFGSVTDISVVNCEFTQNHAGSLGGGLDAFGPLGAVRLANCSFTENTCAFVGGGMVMNTAGGALLTAVNCTFTMNSASVGGGAYGAGNAMLTNCSFGGNVGDGVSYNATTVMTMNNCVVWGNSGGAVVEDALFPGGSVTISSSSIEGGWTGSGSGNIDVNPLFVQALIGNLRLLDGSPCIDAGDTALLPADEHDLDGDGNVTEPVPLDLDGGARVLAGVVDMGAYEGPHDPIGQTDGDDDIDEGETVLLVPGGGVPDPVQTGMLAMTNVSGSDDASATVTQFEIPPVHHDGYVEISVVFDVHTSMSDGEHITTVMVPFVVADLGGRDPFDVELVAAASASDEHWRNAVLDNTVPSPGHAGPEGDRIEVLGPGSLGITQDMGDHGVYWDPTIGAGMAWAKVDHATEFGVGIFQACPADATGDADVDDEDMVAVILAWGSDDPWADVNGDGVVNVMDLVATIVGWGSCP